MADVNDYNYQKVHDKKLAGSICVAATVRVLAFDPAKMTVNVQPLSKHLENGKYESQPPILRIPVACTRCGGFIFRPWLKEGDTGLVVYLDHDIDSTVTGGKEAVPLTERNHAASDAVFVGGIVTGEYSVSGLPTESLALSTEDGSVYVAVTKDKVLIKGDVQLTGKMTVSDGIETAGSLSASGSMQTTGSISATGDVTASGISVAHHTHPGCSGGNTGQPS